MLQFRSGLLCQFLIFHPDAVEFGLVHLFKIEYGILCTFHSSYQLIQLDLHGLSITVLRILNEKYHQESDNGGAGVDHQLPGITKFENRSCKRPQHNDACCTNEIAWFTCGA